MKFVAPNLLDSIMSWVSPSLGLERFRARQTLAMYGGGWSGGGLGGHLGARKSRNQTKAWSVHAGDPDVDDLPDLGALRARSRDLTRNAPLARGAVSTVTTNVVGSGLRLQARIDREVLNGIIGTTDEEFDAFERQLEREFAFWANSPDADASRHLSFAGIQELAFRSCLTSGDVFIVRRFIPRPGGRLSTALQVIEADRIANPLGQIDTPDMAGGVQRDQFGAAIAYRVLRMHPGDVRYWKDEADMIPAWGSSGLPNVIHLMTVERPSQIRGIPYLAPVIETLKQLDQYREAELMAAVVGAMFTVFIKTEDGAELPVQNDHDKDFKMAPGAILSLRQGEDISTACPQRPNQAFDPFTNAILQQIGVALEIPYELLVKHFTASYSAAQAALVEAWKFFYARRAWLSVNLCQPVYAAVITEAVASGRIRAPGFLGDPFIRAAYLGSNWVGPPRGQIDQLKEVNAAVARVNAGFTTIADECAAISGGDFERTHAQRAKEQRMREEEGLVAPVVAPQPPPSSMDSGNTDPQNPDGSEEPPTDGQDSADSTGKGGNG